MRITNTRTTTVAEQWIADWTNNEPVTQINYQAFEILALHRIVDVAMSLFEDGEVSTGPLPAVSISDEVNDARQHLFQEIFKGNEDWRASTVLHSLRSTIMQYFNNSMPAATPYPEQQTGIESASSLAHSALRYRDKAEGFNVIFNIEITAALLQYILTKVCGNILRP
jgi:hypothetical protein